MDSWPSLAVNLDSNQWCSNVMMAYRPVFIVMECSLNNSGDKWDQAGLCDDNNSVQMMFSTMLIDACQDFDTDFPTRYRLNVDDAITSRTAKPVVLGDSVQMPGCEMESLQGCGTAKL